MEADITICKTEKKSVILITNDVKIDWCISHKHQDENRITHPRHELIKEFFDLTNSRFWMYTLHQFLYHYSEIFKSTNQETIDEATIRLNNSQTFSEIPHYNPSNLKPKKELILETGSPNDAVDFINHNISTIGRITVIKHSRNIDDVEYETEIIGEEGIIKISGGLTSGYDGGGPNAFIRLLIQLGFNRELAINYIKGNREIIHSFEIPFDNQIHFYE